MEFLISALAVFYATTVLVDYPGPFNLLQDLRKLADKQPDRRLVELGCFVCASSLVALPVAVFSRDGVFDTIVYWLGLAGAAMLAHVYFESL